MDRFQTGGNDAIAWIEVWVYTIYSKISPASQKSFHEQIIVSQRIAEAVAKRYVLEPLGAVKLKGKHDPLPVALVLGRRSPSAPGTRPRFAQPLVGRERELAQIEALLNTIQTGEGRILRIEGAAGVGKSHLAAELAHRAEAQGLRVIWGACQSTSQSIAYDVWRQMGRALFDLETLPLGEAQAMEALAQQIAQVEARVSAANPDWFLRLPLLGELLGLPIPENETTAAFAPKLRQEALFTLLVEIVHTWANTQPLSLLLEEVHWMGEASLGLTLAVARALADVPVSLVVMQRPPLKAGQPLLPELNALPYYEQLDLSELSLASVVALVRQRLAGKPSPLALDLIQALAQGNPFFTEELVDALRESSELIRQEDGTWALSEALIAALQREDCLVRDKEQGVWRLDTAVAPTLPALIAEIGIPDTLHGVVLSRIDRLPEAPKLTLKIASAVGRIFEFDLLARAYPPRVARGLLLSHLQELEARDFSRLEAPPPHLAYLFKHAITQEVAYDTLLEVQRREEEQTTLQTLDAMPDAPAFDIAYLWAQYYEAIGEYAQAQAKIARAGNQP